MSAYQGHAIGAAQRRSFMSFASDAICPDGLLTVAGQASPRSLHSPRLSPRLEDKIGMLSLRDCEPAGLQRYDAMGASERRSFMSFANGTICPDELLTIAARGSPRSMRTNSKETPRSLSPRPASTRPISPRLGRTSSKRSSRLESGATRNPGPRTLGDLAAPLQSGRHNYYNRPRVHKPPFCSTDSGWR